MSRTYPTLLQIFAGILGILLLIIGCDNREGLEIRRFATVTDQSFLWPTFPTTPTTTASQIFVPAKSQTPTVTQTHTKTPTWTPMPTMSYSQARDYVQALLRTNGGCDLPCWWGITPGKTQWNEAQAFLQSFTMNDLIPLATDYEKENNTIHYEGYFPTTDSPRLQDNMRTVIYVRNNIVDMIDTGIEAKLPEFLSDFGKPSQIWIYSTGIPATGPAGFDIELLYSDEGILAGKSGFGNLIRKGDDKYYLQVCPEEVNKEGISLSLWSPAETRGFDELGRLTNLLGGPPGGPRFQQKYRLIEEISNLNVEEFYEKFSDPKSVVCIETPMDIWQ